MSVGDFPDFCRKHWPRISADLMEGNYHSALVRRVFVPKPDGSKRPLGIPTVQDRMIQQAVAQVISPLLDADFSSRSYGFRPNRSAHQAVETMETGWKEGRRHAVDCYFKSFFDTVNHDKLMTSLREKIRCRKTLGLIRRYLMAGVRLPDGTREATHSRSATRRTTLLLLANIVLDPLDKELETRGHHLARYADDFIILVKSAKAAQRVMESVVRFCEGRLKLVVNRVKSRATLLESCTFLGCQIGHRGKLMWTDKALLRFKQHVRGITRRNRGHKVQDVIDELCLYTRGWLNYYKLSCTYAEVLELSEWVRRSVRLYYWKQWKQPRTRRRNLLALGVFPERIHMASRSRKGYWRMSNNSLVRLALNNCWLEEQGVPNMRGIWISLHYPEQRSVQEV
ncbi:hypothetical protein JO972_15635 [Verrucomicrobiaceae bacterium 5K15]|uniref:Reverse transcriptase domain-containing protein n=2 Tax=Oceaniferula flava TaxID=2800421 RepID=A0AAE2SFH0_9BACT|nr:hypothetical protein [Oceaniferula flavus]MBM1137709.1 hypothetical protein [Oceaniferula flavus]